MTQQHDFTDIAEFFAGLCLKAHETGEPVTSEDHEGTNIWDTYMGFRCGDDWFRLRLDAVKVTPKPMRPHITTKADRERTADAFTNDPVAAYGVLKATGGLRQVDPQMGLTLALMGSLGDAGAAETLKALVE